MVDVDHRTLSSVRPGAWRSVREYAHPASRSAATSAFASNSPRIGDDDFRLGRRDRGDQRGQLACMPALVGDIGADDDVEGPPRAEGVGWRCPIDFHRAERADACSAGVGPGEFEGNRIPVGCEHACATRQGDDRW